MRFILRLFVVLSLVPVTVCQAGLVPRLVRDVDPTSYAGNSSPRQFFSLNHGFGFTAFGGREIWTYDGQEDVLGPTLKSAEFRQLADNLFASRETSGGWRFWHVEGFPYFAAMPIGDPGVAAPRAGLPATVLAAEGNHPFRSHRR